MSTGAKAETCTLEGSARPFDGCAVPPSSPHCQSSIQHTDGT